MSRIGKLLNASSEHLCEGGEAADCFTRVAVARVEHGTSRIAFQSLVRIAGALGTGPAQLLLEAEELVNDQKRYAAAKQMLDAERIPGRPRLKV